MKITSRQADALKIILEFPNLRAREFALHFWPDSHMHKKVSNQGNGACVGKAAWLAGGSYLGKLRNKELVREEFSRYGYSEGFKITNKGKESLEKYLITEAKASK